MKKITFLAFMLTGCMVYAQQTATPVINMLQPTHSGMAPVANTFRQPKVLSSSQEMDFCYGCNAELYQTKVNSVSSNNFGYYLNPIYDDTTAIYNTGTTPATMTIEQMRAGIMFDPASPLWDTTNWTTSPLAGVQYRVDTILINANYQIVNSAVTDTLYVQTAFGPSNSSNWQPMSVADAPTEFFAAPFIHPSIYAGNSSQMYQPMKTIKRVLTAKDTVTVGAQYPGYIVVTDTETVPANNLYAVTCVFVPGHINPAYPANQTVVYTWPGSSPAQPVTQNGMGVYLYGQSNTLTAFAGYFYDSLSTLPRHYNTGLFYMANIPGGHVPDQRYSSTSTFPNNCMLASGIWTDDLWYNIQLFVSYNSLSGIKEYQSNGLKVSQNMPNPFNGITTISYELEKNAIVNLDVFDITGQKVETLSAGNQITGNHTLQLNSASLQAGVYFYTLSAGDDRVTKRMIVIQ